jgi:simple sugar transport system ATP-binding protein
LLLRADLDEVFQLSDRILVFHEGRINAEITDVAGTTEEQLGRYMLGIDKGTVS